MLLPMLMVHQTSQQHAIAALSCGCISNLPVDLSRISLVEQSSEAGVCSTLKRQLKTVLSPFCRKVCPAVVLCSAI